MMIERKSLTCNLLFTRTIQQQTNVSPPRVTRTQVFVYLWPHDIITQEKFKYSNFVNYFWNFVKYSNRVKYIWDFVNLFKIAWNIFFKLREVFSERNNMSLLGHRTNSEISYLQNVSYIWKYYTGAKFLCITVQNEPNEFNSHTLMSPSVHSLLTSDKFCSLASIIWHIELWP